jgi:glycerol-3-phosphate acyltransferase PlsY
MLTRLIVVASAYLVGAIPFGFLLVKHVFTEGEDVRKIGSGGTGATNVSRRAGPAAGLLTYFLDVAKGVAALWLMRQVTDDFFWLGAAGLAAMLGHVFPVYLRFRGGKGVATGFGVFAMLSPLAAVTALLVWVLVVLISRYVSLASMVAAASVPLLTLAYHSWLSPTAGIEAVIVTEILGAALVIGKHHENIGRLIRGTESRVGARTGVSRDRVSQSDDPGAKADG